jgi:hypothetical protein
MVRAGGAFDTDWMFAQLAAQDRCEPEAASAAQSMNGRYAQKAVFAKSIWRPQTAVRQYHCQNSSQPLIPRAVVAQGKKRLSIVQRWPILLLEE